MFFPQQKNQRQKSPIKASAATFFASFLSAASKRSLFFLLKKYQRFCFTKFISFFMSILHYTMFELFLRIFLLMGLINIVTRADDSGDENCETLMSEVHITKDEYNEAGRLIRTCSGDVSVTKCEGFCNSQVQPSVMTTTGFLKECYCCRESYLKERVIKLNHCYDADGIKLENDEASTMDIKLREPADCKCYKCGDFSR